MQTYRFKVYPDEREERRRLHQEMMELKYPKPQYKRLRNGQLQIPLKLEHEPRAVPKYGV